MIILNETKKPLKEAEKVLVIRKGVVGVTTIGFNGGQYYEPAGWELVSSNVGYWILVKSSEKKQYTYQTRDGNEAVDTTKVTFNAAALQMLGVKFK